MIKLSEIHHQANMSDCYAQNSKELFIRLHTGKEVDQVILHAGDPYLAGTSTGEYAWKGTPVAMKLAAQLEFENLWTAVVRPEYRRLKYHFEIRCGQEKIYFLESGFYPSLDFENDEILLQRFIFPWMNPADLFTTPSWAADTVWYQIFPDRFARGDQAEKRNQPKPWDSEETISHRDFFGGDLRGILHKLDYLKELGISGLYLTPILLSDSNHKYDTKDYRMVDPDFGTEEELKELIQKAHEKGLRVMVDAVLNHSGAGFAPWQDVLSRGADSPYADWFFLNQYPLPKDSQSTRDGSYYSFAFAKGMPKLNTSNPAVCDYLLSVLCHWVTDWKVDGIRFDVGNEISHAFIREIRSCLKGLNPDLYLLGEIWHDSLPWLSGGEYDSVMNYPFLQTVNNFWKDTSLSGKQFEWRINRCFHRYCPQANRVLFNLLDSHDTDRLMERVGGNQDAFFQQLTVLLTMEGFPSLYYGTEIGLRGGHDPQNRRCMPWDAIESGAYLDFTERVKALILLRSSTPALRSGEITWFTSEDSRLIHYRKESPDGAVDVYLNASDAPASIPRPSRVLFSMGFQNGTLSPGGTLIGQ